MSELDQMDSIMWLLEHGKTIILVDGLWRYDGIGETQWFEDKPVHELERAGLLTIYHQQHHSWLVAR